jgi:hypothetical protein
MVLSNEKADNRMLKRIILLLFYTGLINGLYAQNEFPAGNFWSLNAGVGMNGIHVEGTSFEFIADPRLWLSPSLMVGSRIGVNYSSETESTELSNILTFEGQVYARWNFLRLGRNAYKKTNIYIQGGLGLISAYRGKDNPFSDVTQTRGSLMADASLGVTIPLTDRWYLEVSGRGGYPHIWGASLTAGIKFPLPGRTEYSEIIKTIPPGEIISRIIISSVEFVIFGPDIGRYNVGIDLDAQELNEMTLNSVALTLRENPELRVRIEGYANPVTPDSTDETGELVSLSAMRANTVAAQLRAKGVGERQIIVSALGGANVVTSDHDIWNRNRRVELLIIQLDNN